MIGRLSRSHKVKKTFQTLEEALRACRTEDLREIVENINRRFTNFVDGGKVQEHLELITQKLGTQKSEETRFRNIIAHTVRRIFEKTYSSAELRKLARIWKEFWEPLSRITENYLNTSGRLLPHP